jgi:glycosyltransferase involved in cell wall biosynthesis
MQRRYEGVTVHQGGRSEFISFMVDFDPDVIAVHAPHYLQFHPLLEGIKTPFVCWIHGSEALWSSTYHERISWRDPLKLVLLRRFLVRAAGVVYVSRWMKRIAQRNMLFYHHKNSRVIPNPVDEDLFKWRKRESSPWAVAVRGFHWKYGLDVALEAFKHLPKVHLTILGSGSRYEEQLLRSHAPRNVEILSDPVDHSEMPAFLDNFSFFIAPSRVEAQGLAMCEALSCGLPVVASNVGGIPEFIQDGCNGFLFHSGDPKELGRKIFRLLTEDKLFPLRSERAGESAREMFSGEAVYNAEKDLFSSVQESENIL